MGKIIDERVVEMRFDNKLFEKNVKTTMSTLEKLKNALNFTKSTETLKDLEEQTKKISVDKIASSLEFLEHRFSALGIVGMRVIENITDSLMGSLNNAIKFVTDSIVSGGVRRATNIENAHFQLQALLKDEVKVQAVMADAMESVDGTAYAYDEAAKAASQFAASGLQAGEEMLGALKGITGVAAMTNSSFEDISRIFTTVAGNGRLMGDQLLQLSGRGLNAASTIADYFRQVRGEANMTEATIREMVSKGQLDFKTFSDAMTWAFGDSAKRANETFTGALSNMKSALARIGAGFVSPLIEQNSDLVGLFNALRIQINNVKSALVFDEQKSAISGLSKESDIMVETISKFVSNGTTSFDKFTTAIIGAKKNEEELSEINDLLSKSYAELKENGKATTETFDTFTKSGIDATKAVREYVNGVLDGSIKASKEVKQSIIEITEGAKLLGGDARRLAEDGKISYDIFTSAIVNYSGAVEKGSTLASEAVSNLMSLVKKNGSVSRENLEEFSRNGISALKALQEYINGVSEGSIRATYSTKQAIEELTQGAKVSVRDITKYAEDGKISYDIFQSAIEHTYGDQKALSKQFTEFVLDNIKALVQAVESADLSKPMETFYYGVESFKNLMKGLWSILRPMGKAFSDVFLSFSGDDVLNLAASIEKLTSKMKLSEKGSKNLQDAFHGVFSVVKLLTDGVFRLLGISTSAIDPINSMTDLFLEFVGGAGRGLTKFTEWVRQAPIIKNAFSTVSKGFNFATSKLSHFISNIDVYMEKIHNLPITQKIVKKSLNSFESLKTIGGKYFDIIVDKINTFKLAIKELIPKDVEFSFENLSNWISAFVKNLKAADLSSFSNGVGKLTDKIRELWSAAKENKGFDAFITNLSEFLNRIGKAFTIDNIVSNINLFKESISGFVKWIGDTTGILLEDISLGGIFTAGSTIAIIYTFLKAIKSFEKFTKTIKVFPDFLGTIKGVLTQYQKDIKATSILKIAAAIGILAVSITLLSFADMKQAWQAATMLGLVGAALLYGAGTLLNALNKTRGIGDATFQFAKGLKKGMSNLAKSVKWASIAAAITSVGVSLALIAASIISIGVMYRKDPEALNQAVELVKKIGIVLAGVMTISSIFGGKITSGASAFAKAALGVLGISVSLRIVVSSLNKLFKMDIPSDWKTKFGILTAIMLELGALSLVMGIVGKFTSTQEGTKAGSLSSSPIIGFSALLLATVYALDKLFKIDIPNDYGAKLLILGGVFLGLESVIITMGIASKLAEGKLKAGGTILALSVFLFSVVGSLMILKNIPGDQLLKGVLAIDAVLLALSITLAGAGEIKKDSKAYMSVLAMSIALVSIVGSLTFLKFIPGDQLLKGILAIDAVLLALGSVFKKIGTIESKESYVAVIAGVIMLAEIAGVLAILSEYSWEKILFAAISLKIVMSSFSKMLLKVSETSTEFDIKTLGTFLTAMAALSGIAASLYFLAEQPWDGLLAGGIALSMVLITFGKTLEIISNSQIDLKKSGSFLVATLSLIPVVTALIALDQLTNGDWTTLLASSAAISLLLATVGGIMILMTKFQVNIASAANAALGFSAFIAILGVVLIGIGALFDYFDGLEDKFQKGIDIMVLLGRGIGEFVGAIVGGFKDQGLSGGNGSNAQNSLPSFGQQLTDFMDSAVGFFEGLKNVTPESVEAAKGLGAMMLGLTASQLLQGIGNALGLSGSFAEFGKELEAFAPSIVAFATIVEGIDADSVKGAASACEILATCADKLPYDPDSWAGKIFGKKSLEEFGNELLSFAPNIVAFATIVDGINVEAIEGAAAACEILATCADKLPSDPDSWAGKIFGKKSFSEFGEELVSFAPDIVQFSMMVVGVKESSVKGVEAVCNIMAACANELPSSDGLAQKIFGKKSLSEFGEELSSFAPKVLRFSMLVSGVNADSVKGVESVLTVMSMLANELPDSGGIVSWFAGDNSIDNFGERLESFGKSFQKFYKKIDTIVPDKVTNVVASLYSLMQLSNIAKNTDTTKVTEFVDSLKNLGDEGVVKFLSSFTNSQEEVNASVSQFVSATSDAFAKESKELMETTAVQTGLNIVSGIQNGIEEKSPELLNGIVTTATNIVQTIKGSLPDETFSSIGQGITISLDSGISTEEPTILQTVGELCSSTINEFSDDLPNETFDNIGQKVVDSLSDGINIKESVAGLSAQNVADTVRTTLSNGLDSSKLEPIGENVAEGLSSGINNKINRIASAAASAAQTILNVTRQKLDINSPSKEMFKLGEFTDEGMAGGIIHRLGLIAKASDSIADEVMTPVQNAISTITKMIDDGTFNFDPVVTPVVDLSNIQEGATEVARLFNKSLAVPSTYQEALGAATVFEASMRRKQAEKDEKKVTPQQPVETKVEFNQYNTSPKALSRYDIYRNTSNQLAAYERASKRKWLNR